MPTTIHDVAKKLNLSITTVSRALDGYDDVAESTRKLVIATAKNMRYAPNRAARQLRRQKADTVGFIIPSISKHFNEPFFTEFMAGLGDELSKRNFDLLVSNATEDEAERAIYHRWVNSQKVDGFILTRLRRHDWRVAYLSEWGIPFAGLGRSHDGVSYPSVRIEAADVYLNLVQHLRDRGFSRLAFIGGPADLINQLDRLRWFKRALKKLKLKLDPVNLVTSDMSSNGAYEAVCTLLSRRTRPDALLCINDQTAYGALHAAHEHGLTVGSDIAIAGFDGLRDSSHTEPPLTTLAVPMSEIAHALVQMLLKKINGEAPEDEEVVVLPELCIRASTGG